MCDSHNKDQTPLRYLIIRLSPRRHAIIVRREDSNLWANSIWHGARAVSFEAAEAAIRSGYENEPHLLAGIDRISLI